VKKKTKRHLNFIERNKTMMKGHNKTVKETVKLIPQNSVGAELGVWKGDSSIKFLAKASFLHLVDSWSPIAYKDSDEHGDYEGYLQRYKAIVGSDNPDNFKEFYDEIYSDVQARFTSKPVKIHRMTTREWFKVFHEKIDWIYVDANHAYDDALNDLHESFKRIKSGGLLFADDYSNNKPGVKKAIEEFSKITKLSFSNFYKDQIYFNVP